MSLVNQMLQELDRRHAADAPDGDALAAKVRPTRRAAVGSEWFWRALAVLMVCALGWVGWVIWELMPRSNVTDLALRSPPAPRAPAQSSTPAPVPAPQAAAAPQPSKPFPDASQARPDMLMLAREISTPIRARPARALPAVPPSSEQASPPQAAEPRARAAARTLAVEVQPAAASGQIDKRDSNTPHERAEAEFRRALTFVNQGRMAEGMEAFRAALTLDPGYETARQTHVSLLLDARRVDEAAVSLQEGLEINPGNTTFASLLARILVERNDLKAALALLQKHGGAAGNNADYLAFVAALQQRLGQYREASEQYQQALRLAPQAGPWWVGLGISFESLRRDTDAAQAFRRAREAGSLNAELASYVDQRLKALP
jgi:MSHA biogenesis protein MshN